MNFVGGSNFKVLVVSLLVMLVFGMDVSHAGDLKSTDSSTNSVKEVARAKKLLNNGDSKEALYSLNSLLNSSLNDEQRIDVLFLQGKAFRAIGSYKKAIASYSKIVELTHPGIDRILALSYRAELYELANNFDQALIDRDLIKNSK